MVQRTRSHGLEVKQCFFNHFKLQFFSPQRDVPSYGVYIIAYEWIFDKVCDRKSGQLPSPFQLVWVGGVAGRDYQK